LLVVLDPDVVLRADPAAVQIGASQEVRGAMAVAGTFSGRARFAQPALVNGAAGTRMGSGRTAACCIRVHDHTREDRRNRSGRRSRALQPARPGRPERLTGAALLEGGRALGDALQ